MAVGFYAAAVNTASAQNILTLEDCRQKAVEYNKELINAAYSKDVAIENQKSARTAYLPGFKATASIMYRPNMDDISMPGNFLPTAANAELAELGEYTGNSNVWMPGMNISLGNLALIMGDFTFEQAIYAGGKIKYLNEQADAGIEIFKHAYELKYDEVIEQTDQAFWNLVSANAQVELSEKYIEMLTELESQMSEMHQLGLSMLSEKLKVTVQKNEAQLNLVKVKNGLRIARMYLNHLTGQRLDLDYEIDNKLNNGSLDLVNFHEGINQALDHRKELMILNEQLNISKYDQKIARSEYLPQIGVSAGYSTIYINNISEKVSFNPSLAGQILVPLFQWGQGKHKQNAAKIKIKQAEIELENTTSLISLEVQKVKSQLEEAYETAVISNTNLSEAKLSLDEIQSSFEVGLNTITDVLSAQANWKKANMQNIVALAQYASLQTSWKKATGQIKHPEL